MSGKEKDGVVWVRAEDMVRALGEVAARYEAKLLEKDKEYLGQLAEYRGVLSRLTKVTVNLEEEYYRRMVGLLDAIDEKYNAIEQQGKGRREKIDKDAEILAFAKAQYRSYRDAGQSMADARSTAMVDVGDYYSDKKGNPVTRGRTWISTNLKD